MRSLFVIVKLTSKCNLSCTYCNIFHGEDTTVYSQPNFFTSKLGDRLGNFIQRAIENGAVETVNVVLHGGEPLLLKKQLLEEIAKNIVRGNSNRVSLTLQTNGTLIDEGWLDLFERMKIRLGISIDGYPEIHDAYRVDKIGRATSSSVANGVRLAQSAFAAKRITSLTTLTVWNPKLVDARKFYEYITKTLEIKAFDVLFPDITHNTVHFSSISGIGRFMSELNEEWFHGPSEIVFRFGASLFALLSGGSSLLTSIGQSDAVAVTIDVDGELRLDDHLRSCGDGFTRTGLNLADATLEDYLEAPLYKSIQREMSDIPKPCNECLWRSKCRGGELIHRYNKHSFSSKSVYCEHLKEMFAHTARIMIEHGFQLERLAQNLA